MSISVVDGFRVTNNAPVDDRIVYDTKANALAGIASFRRYEGLAIFITSEGKQYRFVGGVADGNLVLDTTTLMTDVTHAQLTTLIGANGLIPGQSYRITDFRTKHCICNGAGATAISPAVINEEGADNPIIVKAMTNNKLEKIAFQPAYPDDVIAYNVADVLCEDGATARKGIIQMRWDMNRDVCTGYDWRNWKFRRYLIDVTGIADYNSGTTYARNALVKSGTTIYISNLAGNTNNAVTSDWWFALFTSYTTAYHCTATSKNYSDFTLTANTASYKDMYTFHNLTDDTCSTVMRTTHIKNLDAYQFGTGGKWAANNIVFQLPSNAGSVFCGDQFFDMDCYDMNFIGSSFLANRFGPLCGESHFRNIQSCDIWGRSLGLFTGQTVLRMVGCFTRMYVGPSSSLITAQSTSSCRLNASCVNINIIGLAANLTLGNGCQRWFINRPEGQVHILNNIDGQMLGAFPGDYTIVDGATNLTAGQADIEFRFTKTFTGAAGSGAVGAVTLLDTLTVPAPFMIEEIFIRPTGITFNATAKLNIGFGLQTTAGLDNTTGDLATITAGGTYRVRPTGPTGGGDLFVLNVIDEAITAGSMVITVKLKRV